MWPETGGKGHWHWQWQWQWRGRGLCQAVQKRSNTTSNLTHHANGGVRELVPTQPCKSRLLNKKG